MIGIRFPLEDYIGIMIHQTDLSLTQYVKHKLAPFGITPEQNLIMMLLWREDGLSQHDITQLLGKDKTNVARMLYSLESKNFIYRTDCPDDRRSLRVYLTDKGKQLKLEVKPIAESFSALVTQGISDEELALMRRLLNTIRDNVCAQIQKSN